MSNKRIRLEYDELADLSYVVQFNTPETYAGNEALDGGKPIPFERYVETWGNPEHYVSFVAFAEVECECCGSWVVRDTLGGIDFYTGPGSDLWPMPGVYDENSAPNDLAFLFADMDFQGTAALS